MGLSAVWNWTFMTIFPFPPSSLRNRRKWGSGPFLTRGQSSGTGDTPVPGAPPGCRMHFKVSADLEAPPRELSFLC